MENWPFKLKECDSVVFGERKKKPISLMIVIGPNKKQTNEKDEVRLMGRMLCPLKATGLLAIVSRRE